MPSGVMRVDFEEATKTFWTENELRFAELSSECPLYQMRAETLSLRRNNLWTPTFLPNEFH